MLVTRFGHVQLRDTCEGQLRRYWPCVQGSSADNKVAWQAKYNLPVASCGAQQAANDRECFHS
eukprot:7021042-Prymnesium_polylepis.1